MKITEIEAIPVAIPYSHDGPLTGFGGSVWPKLTYLLVKVCTEDGLVGWGEAFGYNAIPATRAALEQIVKPLALGKDVDDLAAFMLSLKKPLHLFGRSGPVQYALSGLDIALWDLAGKRAGLPVSRLLAKEPRTSISAYKSFMRLKDPAIISAACARAREQGFSSVKLHEITVEAVAAARQALGDEVNLMLDVNCEWVADDAVRMARALEPYNLKWLEEPVWPPEDVGALLRMKTESAVPLALGENLANAWSFYPLLQDGVIDYYQPSVTKVGGISEFIDIAQSATAQGRRIAPHSPYFGPGLLATVQLAAAYSVIGGIEVFGVELDDYLFGQHGLPGSNGEIAVPANPGLGCDPDPEIIAKYRL